MGKIVLISGGTATNSLISVLNDILDAEKISFILPVSDNGGSSAEILYKFGGPAIGDLRSRITTIGGLLGENSLINKRLNQNYPQKAFDEWKHMLSMLKETEINQNSNIDREIYKYFKYLDDIISKENVGFNFQNASIGNLLMLSLRLYHNLDLYRCSLKFINLLIRDSHMDKNIARNIFNKFDIFPCINSEVIDETFEIAAKLDNADLIIGQNNISHPSTSHITFNKFHDTPLVSPVDKLFYITKEQKEVRNHLFIKAQQALENSDVIVYSIGSLITSILPVVILDGFSFSILRNKNSTKILMLNGNLDRETSNYNIVDFIYQIIKSLIYSLGIEVRREFTFTQIKEYENSDLLENYKRSIRKLAYLEKFFLIPNKLCFTDFITDIYIPSECNIEIHSDIVVALTGINCTLIKSDISPVVGKYEKRYTYNLQDFKVHIENLLKK